MKDNVLLVGKLNTTIRNIHIMMKEHFDVQLCTGDSSVVDGMIKLLRPKMVVISLTDYEKRARKALELIDKKYSHIIVVVLGNQEELSNFS